ncbi:Cytochrome b5 reductase 4 [Varanus komodoensis]|nr:Cytochrome b5 reductase 4 [Varanus komodoensis]
MLNVPSSAFPAPASQQRVALAGRSKVPLKPGRSLMDWIRLTKSGKDLAGLKGRLVEVTEEELAKHNTKDDCWICIRGLVYNVTPYMEYHPGGEDELMKAAGADGTDLFDQVHRWVNYESMLKECMVGRMALKPLATVLKGNMNYESVIVDLQEVKLRGEIIVKDYSYLIYIELSNAVHEDIIVQVFEKVGKVELILKKKEILPWKKLGQPMESHNSFVKRTDRDCSAKKRIFHKFWVQAVYTTENAGCYQKQMSVMTLDSSAWCYHQEPISVSLLGTMFTSEKLLLRWANCVFPEVLDYNSHHHLLCCLRERELKAKASGGPEVAHPALRYFLS